MHPEVQHDLIERCKEHQRTLENFRAAAIEIALELASTGGKTHKEKDERMMRAIARLLAFTTNYRVESLDVPF